MSQLNFRFSPRTGSVKRLIKPQLRRLIKIPKYISALAAWAILLLFTFGRLLLNGLEIRIVSQQLVIGGVPLSIILIFLRDRTARRAYFRKDCQTLHNRLYVLGIEEKIKDFYRPQISDEIELDRYIHQLLYERTGYVGKDYWLNEQNILVEQNQNSKKPGR